MFFFCFLFFVYIVQSIVMVNLNIYFCLFSFCLSLTMCINQTNQVIIIMLYVYIFTKDLFILHFVYEFFIFSKNAHFLNVFFSVIH